MKGKKKMGEKRGLLRVCQEQEDPDLSHPAQPGGPFSLSALHQRRDKFESAVPGSSDSRVIWSGGGEELNERKEGDSMYLEVATAPSPPLQPPSLLSDPAPLSRKTPTALTLKGPHPHHPAVTLTHC